MVIRLFAAMLFLSSAAHAADPVAGKTSMTIYSKSAAGSDMPYPFFNIIPPLQIPGYAVVRSTRSITLPEKISTVQFSDVAKFIDPATVIATSLTHPEETQVLEQSYLFDAVSNEKMLEKYIGTEIEVDQLRGDNTVTIRGMLVSTSGGLMLQDKDGNITTIVTYSALRFPKLPEGLVTKPILIWKIRTAKPGDHIMQISYQTAGISWSADYNLVFSEGKTANSGKVDLGAWVSIVNQSGMAYHDASLKLMAGDVHRVVSRESYAAGAPMMMKVDVAAMDAPQEKALFDYHLYTLATPVTLPENATKQFVLFPVVQNIPAERIYRFNAQVNSRVESVIRFTNSKKHGLGIPLPAGKIRANTRDTDGMPEFIGENTMHHTPKDEPVEIMLGNAMDITGTRTVLKRKEDNDRRLVEEEVEVTLRNHKDKDVVVVVNENIYVSQSWNITDNNLAYEKKNANTIQFKVTLDKDQEKKIYYVVKYLW